LTINSGLLFEFADELRLAVEKNQGHFWNPGVYSYPLMPDITPT
jgi:hypothetical protein